MTSIVASIRRELQALWRSPWQLALVSYIPILSILCLWWLFSAGLPRQLPVAIVDHDNSQLSRMLSRKLAANPVISPQSFVDLPAAVTAMRQAEVYGIIVFPYGLKRDLVTGHSPTIDIRYNSQFLLVGKLLSSQIQLTLGAGLLDVAGMKLLFQGVPKSQVAVSLSPVTSQTTALFNRNNNYVGFLVPPVLVALLQLLAMLIFSNSLSRELTPTGSLIAGDGIWLRIGAKIALFTPILLMHGSFILVLLYQYLALPAAGDLVLLILAQTVMLLAIWLVVLLIFFIMRDSARMASFGTAMFAPAFAFMGITFPVHEMPLLAQWWRLIMPSSHYIDSHVSIISYGSTWQTIVVQFASYWGFLFIIPVLIVLSRRIVVEPLTQISLAGESGVKG
ncbi:ABC transporter permease [Shewanella sp. D64]|uniref:ABC transporter permease n=1 Tax=unclassified Shewanella TaxID=196818 RepID=UPI0022BA6A27|nr:MULTISPECIES: ABC transporter permease [unclassified Shewanella]MEC4725466.1 ABC transporter permease [Shewanella sp. D64]MEC4738715.1 ABC transporter permease [Shewanella sp. E94]WBJ95009.1 ABC transporter permease [Shewanella sp. MTB7]